MSSFSTPLPFLQTWTGAGGSVILHKIFVTFNLLKVKKEKHNKEKPDYSFGERLQENIM